MGGAADLHTLNRKWLFFIAQVPEIADRSRSVHLCYFPHPLGIFHGHENDIIFCKAYLSFFLFLEGLFTEILILGVKLVSLICAYFKFG